jgi:hypothetical protein
VAEEQIRELLEDVLGVQLPPDADRQALPRELIDAEVQSGANEHPTDPSFMNTALNRVLAPHMVRTIRPKCHARAIVQLQTTALQLLLRHLQPHSPSDPVDTLLVHLSSVALKQSGDPVITVSPILLTQLNHDIGQRLLTGTARTPLP